MGVFAKWFITVAVYLFAFTSIIANYYYSETNLEFIKKSSALLLAFRLTMVALLIVVLCPLFLSCGRSPTSVWGL